ncbi:MAG: hypothetical protein JXR51_11480 [Bacteroidales bacterium]|nr:hypothetical protein [Bacteroidales bacterium]MBN2757791.1 hypothetical protein [Bacteroidales bacterium]
MQKNILEISPKAFWDVDFEKLMTEVDNYPEFIIKKVFEYGTFADVINVVKYFGKQKAIKTLTNTVYLKEKTLHFAAAFFKLKKNNFACYLNKQQRHSYTKY